VSDHRAVLVAVQENAATIDIWLNLLMVQSVRLSIVTVSILLFARRTLFAIFFKKIPNSHRPTRRDETVSVHRVDSGGANWP